LQALQAATLALHLRHSAGAANTKALSGTSGFRSPKEFLEVAVLGEDVGQRLVHDLIGGGVEKGCIPVDLLAVVRRANRRGDLSG